MNRAYLDTTVLTDVLLKDDARAKAALGRFAWTGLPVYAIKEFRAGPLKNWVWFHNKLAVNSFPNALRELGRMASTPRKNVVLTAIESLQLGAKDFEKMTAVETLGRYPHENLGEIIRDHYRLHLKRTIIQSWRERRSVTTEVLQELPCYAERAPILEGNLIEMGHLGCDHRGECCMAPALLAQKGALGEVLKVLDRLPPKPENQRRIKILKEIVKGSKRLQLGDRECRGLGDIIFAMFCPGDAAILTTNVKDHTPLATVFRKQVESLDAPEAGSPVE